MCVGVTEINSCERREVESTVSGFVFFMFVLRQVSLKAHLFVLFCAEPVQFASLGACTAHTCSKAGVK